MSYIFPMCCAPCAKRRIEAENAERALDATAYEPALAKTTPTTPPVLRVAS